MSEALRLADLISSRYGNDLNDEAAAELRRLHAENEYLAGEVKKSSTERMRTVDLIASEFRELTEKNAELLEALQGMVSWAENSAEWDDIPIEQARAVLAKATRSKE